MGNLRDSFGACHPVVNFLYFGFVILVTIFFLHPVLLGISFVSALIYSICLGGRRQLRFNLALLLPLMLVAALINPAFNHRGITILFYLRDNPVTLESVLYGIVSAVMIGSVILWFSCYNRIMTSDKFLYLFGRLIPALSLIISMALRFIPRYKAQIKRITGAQRGIGRDVSSGNLIDRIRNGLTILSVMITWALENAIDTADSMKSRGYGLKGRTAYSIYRFDARDRTLLIIMLALIAVTLTAICTHAISILYFPMFLMNDTDGTTDVPVPPYAPYAAYAGYFIICMMPMIVNIREDFVWQSLRSKI
jgi:energy-coupling factor transport system permease protein